MVTCEAKQEDAKAAEDKLAKAKGELDSVREELEQTK